MITANTRKRFDQSMSHYMSGDLDSLKIAVGKSLHSLMCWESLESLKREIERKKESCREKGGDYLELLSYYKIEEIFLL